jgi:hypothetical protein
VGVYATSDDVQRRNPYRTISATSSPSTTDVEEFIAEAEAALHAALSAAQARTPVTDANGARLLKAWVLDYCEGRVRQAYAAAGGDGNNDDGAELVQKFWERLDDVMNNATRYSSMLSGGAADPATRRLRSYRPTSSNESLDPTFTKADPEGQL